MRERTQPWITSLVDVSTGVYFVRLNRIIFKQTLLTMSMITTTGIIFLRARKRMSATNRKDEHPHISKPISGIRVNEKN